MLKKKVDPVVVNRQKKEIAKQAKADAKDVVARLNNNEFSNSKVMKKVEDIVLNIISKDFREHEDFLL